MKIFFRRLMLAEGLHEAALRLVGTVGIRQSVSASRHKVECVSSDSEGIARSAFTTYKVAQAC